MKQLKSQIKPQQLKEDKLKAIVHNTEEGLKYAILIALMDGKSRTTEQIQERVNKICITAACEVNRREGLVKVSKNFDWFTNWNVKMIKMKCPKCNTIYEPVKGSRFCPMCGLDLMALAEKEFPNLKKKLNK